MMNVDVKPLFGGCTCGRNQYTIALIPTALSSNSPNILFDDSPDISRLNSSPLSLYLRVPLEALHSTTYAFFDDETHADIRRVFTPCHSSNTRRVFCGYCGTPLSIWTESKPSESEFVRVSLSSLDRASLDALEEMGFLGPGDEPSLSKATKPSLEDDGMQISAPQSFSIEAFHERQIQGHPWFEETLEGSELGRMRRRKGGHSSADGWSRVEWEIVEYESEDEGEVVGVTGSVKRKLDNVVDEDDVVMKHSR